MTQICWIAAAFALTGPLAHRLGALRPMAGRHGSDAVAVRVRRYTLADLVEHPAILVGIRCWDGDRESLEPLLETFVPRERHGALPTDAIDGGPDFLP